MQRLGEIGLEVSPGRETNATSGSADRVVLGAGWDISCSKIAAVGELQRVFGHADQSWHSVIQ